MKGQKGFEIKGWGGGGGGGWGGGGGYVSAYPMKDDIYFC